MPAAAAPAPKAAVITKPAAKTAAPTPAPASAKRPTSAGKPATPPSAKVTAAVTTPSKPTGASATNETAAALQEELTALTTVKDGLEREREFYFSKLREIEVLLCQDDKISALSIPTLKQQILDILYKTDVDFAPPTEADLDVAEEKAAITPPLTGGHDALDDAVANEAGLLDDTF